MGQIPSMMKQEFIETLRTNPVKLTINEKKSKFKIIKILFLNKVNLKLNMREIKPIKII